MLKLKEHIVRIIAQDYRISIIDKYYYLYDYTEKG